MSAGRWEVIRLSWPKSDDATEPTGTIEQRLSEGYEPFAATVQFTQHYLWLRRWKP